MLVEKLGLSRDLLANKVAIITGAGRGIGKELARTLSWLGATVIIAEINDYGKNVEDLIKSEGGNALFVKTDVSNEEDIKNLEEIAINTFGRVDILINNAYVGSAGEILNISMEDWDKVYRVNIRGAIFAIKTFLPYMIKQNAGVINTVTSAEGWPYMAPYFATKTALMSIGKSLASELDDTNISVFVFAPGMIDTPGLQEYIPVLAPKYGMTEHEFKTQGVNPGYEGLMPAEHCAAGWAYCIVNAQEYHGQVGEPFLPLLQKGLIRPKKRNGSKDLKPGKKIDFKEKISDTVIYSEKVLGIVEKIQIEISDLGIMARKWMNRTFSKRCGMRIEKCIEVMTELDNKIHQLSYDIHNNTEVNYPGSIENLSWYIQILENLADHFHKSIDDAKGWIKDPEDLEIALNALNDREQAVVNLVSNLNAIDVTI
ncbi:MAG: SDR family oxidoreductase [Candidatus Lokiarchaeota archaeon]|nr:SDR family oxidoreductase [Candidatus Lokiarchaeota archaeon]